MLEKLYQIIEKNKKIKIRDFVNNEGIPLSYIILSLKQEFENMNFIVWKFLYSCSLWNFIRR